MKYIQFYRLSTGYIEGTVPPQFDKNAIKSIEACGSDGVMKVDGKFGPATIRTMAESVCQNRKFVGWQLMQGASFSSSRPAGPYCPYTKN